VISKVRTYYAVRYRAKSGIYTGYVQESALGEIAIETTPPPPKGPAEPAPKPVVARRHYEVGGYYSLLNSFQRGGLDVWWQGLTGRAADQGSAAFMMLEAAAYFPLRMDRWYLGASASCHIPLGHAVWGSQDFEGGMQEVDLKPGFFSFGVPLRYFPLSSRALSITAVPSLLFGWAGGTYLLANASGTFPEDFSPRAKIGMGIAGGLEYAFLKNLAVSARVELRALSVPLIQKSTAQKIATLDLGGSAVLLGFVFRL